MLFSILFACSLTSDTKNSSENTDLLEDTNIEDPTESNDDGDDDGYSESEGDCDDSDPAIFPGANDTWYDGVDSDCAGNDDYDQDADGSISDLHGGDDCDDSAPAIYPGANDTWYDGVDSDCAGNDDYDQDADGDISDSYGGGDCDDLDGAFSSLVSEIWYDGIDQNCDGWNDWDADMDGVDDRAVDLSNAPRFLMELHPIGDYSNNALQGIAVDLTANSIWTTIDTSSFQGNALLNRLSLDSGTSQYCEAYNASSIELGHAQDLSLEYNSSGQLSLWTGSDSDMGVSKIDPDSQTIDVIPDLLPAGWSHSTPTVGLNNQWIAVRGSLDGDSVQNDWIRIYDKAAVESAFITGNNPSTLYEFNIDAAQRVDAMWFQGIALDEELELVYALTGNSSLSQNQKLLYVYDLYGNIVDQTTISMDWALANSVGSKYEPEGLSLVKDPVSEERYLYFSMMFGSSGNNIKRLYTTAPSTFSAGGGYSGDPINWLLRYDGSDGDVSIATIDPSGEIGCEVKNTTWSTGWTSFLSYQRGGEPYLFIQKESAGTTRIHPLDWDGYMNSATKDSTWSSGWDTFDTWEYGGSSYLFHYKYSTGLAKVSELTSAGDTSCCSENETWTSGWFVHIYEGAGGADYLLRYSLSTGQYRVMNLGAGIFGSEITNDYWLTAAYTNFASTFISGNPYLFAMRSSGTVDVLSISSGGVIGSVVDSVTIGSGWHNMFATEINGVAFLFLHNQYTGAYESYELDSSGQIIGLYDSGNYGIGWSAMLHFQTEVP